MRRERSKIKIPCEQCVCMAICRSKNPLECSILYAMILLLDRDDRRDLVYSIGHYFKKKHLHSYYGDDTYIISWRK